MAYVTFRISLRKGRYFGNLQWEIMRKVLTAWANIYVSGLLVMGDMIYARDGDKFTETACLTRGLWFGIFMRVSKLQMGVIKKQYFGVTSDMIKYFLEGWDTDWRRRVLTRKREISCLVDGVVICFCGGLIAEEFFLMSLKGMLKFWEEKRNKKYLPHVMVKLKGRFKGETRENWHMLPLAETTGLGI